MQTISMRLDWPTFFFAFFLPFIFGFECRCFRFNEMVEYYIFCTEDVSQLELQTWNGIDATRLNEGDTMSGEHDSGNNNESVSVRYEAMITTCKIKTLNYCGLEMMYIFCIVSLNDFFSCSFDWFSNAFVCFFDVMLSYT